MFFEGKSSQKYLGNIYKFFEKWNSFARVTTWQSSNIGCFFVVQFQKFPIAPGRMISKITNLKKKWKKRKVKEYSKGIDPEYKDEDANYEVTRSDIKILKQIHSLGDEQYKRLIDYFCCRINKYNF